MCRNIANIDTDLVDEIRNVVTDLVTNKVLFTAYDVTVIIRKDRQATHKEVREVVHFLYEDVNMPGYDRKFQRVNGTKARVYFPQGSDPATYDPDTLVSADKDFDPVLGF